MIIWLSVQNNEKKPNNKLGFFISFLNHFRINLLLIENPS